MFERSATAMPSLAADSTGAGRSIAGVVRAGVMPGDPALDQRSCAMAPSLIDADALAKLARWDLLGELPALLGWLVGRN